VYRGQDARVWICCDAPLVIPTSNASCLARAHDSPHFTPHAPDTTVRTFKRGRRAHDPTVGHRCSYGRILPGAGPASMVDAAAGPKSSGIIQKSSNFRQWSAAVSSRRAALSSRSAVFPPWSAAVSSRRAAVWVAREHGRLSDIVEAEVEEDEPLESDPAAAVGRHPVAHRVNVGGEGLEGKTF